jgi:hypothetical protein
MEKYTFLKFIKIKEKEIKNKIKNLKNQIGGSPPFDLNDILLQIADFENKLSSITSITSAPFMTSYESLKTTIDEINKKIETFKQELINKSITPDDDNILNKLKRVNEFMNVGNYELIRQESFYMITEPVPTDTLTSIIKSITSQFADKLKKIKLDITKNKNDNNEEINKNIEKINDLIKEYNKNILEFEGFKDKINSYIANLTTLYTFELVEPIDHINSIRDNEDIYINVNETINDENIDKIYNDIISSDGTIAKMGPGGKAKSVPGLGLGLSLGSSSGPSSTRIKYYKKFFNKSDYKKNIINLHKEWLEILKNYKNKLENKLENKILIGGSPTTILKRAVSAPSIITQDRTSAASVITQVPTTSPDRDTTSIDFKKSQSSSKHISDLIQVFIKYENKVREFKKLSNDIIKLVKEYNVRYVQFMHFQNWITKYIEDTITSGVYGYYKYIGLGQISYNAKILLELKNKLEKFNITENLSKDDLEIIKKEIYRRFYKFHFFIINILENFFRKLEEYWKVKDFNVHSLIKTESENQEISNYFFLFNIFETTLSDYRIDYFKKVANYIRINKIPDRTQNITAFNKTESGNQLSLLNLKECDAFIQKYGDGVKRLDAISKIKFEEVFDEINFKENNKIAQYIGISDMLKRLSSTMILTYGYSGTGKTFTIFGSSKKGDAESAIDGMLQSILKKLGSGITIQVKTFELYGLGVPYKFYWKDSSKIDHRIYSYPFSKKDITPITYYNIAGIKKGRPNVDTNFTQYLRFTNDYHNLDNDDIANFSNFIDKINNIRKENGRIKKTLNNPESSRGILFCDFKITINKNEVNLVIADIPGKEKKKETYCDDVNISVKDIYKTFKFYDISGRTPGAAGAGAAAPPTPRGAAAGAGAGAGAGARAGAGAGAGAAAATAAAGPSDVDAEEELDVVDEDVMIPVDVYDPNIEMYNEKLLKLLIFSNPLWLSMIPETAEVFDYEAFSIKRTNFNIKQLLDREPNINLPIYNVTVEKKKSFFKKLDKPIKHSNKGLKFFDNDKNDKYKNNRKTILRLRGLKERALFRIVNLIQNDLEGLGLLLDEMVKNEYNNKKQGYAGLEAVYINENIGCILQILSNKIKKDKGLDDKIPILCEQENYYSKKILEKDLNKDLESQLRTHGLTTISDDEFFSLIHYLNTYEKKNFINSITTNTTNQGLFDINDIYKNKFRLITDNDFTGEIKDSLIKYDDEPYISFLNIYNYDRLFNIKEPSIGYILQPYIDKIKNFYLLFVVTNSDKQDGTNICKEQNELLYETINFMKVIADPTFEPRLQCE